MQGKVLEPSTVLIVRACTSLDLERVLSLNQSLASSTGTEPDWRVGKRSSYLVNIWSLHTVTEGNRMLPESDWVTSSQKLNTVWDIDVHRENGRYRNKIYFIF